MKPRALVPTLMVAAALAAGDAAEAAMTAAISATMGKTDTPFPSPEARSISGLLTTFLAQGEASLTPSWSLSLRVPLVLADVYLPAGGARPTTAFGHPEAALAWHLLVADGWRATVGAGVAAPIGGGDAALGRRPFENQALVLASAQTGWRDRALFAPGRLGLIPAAQLDHQVGWLSVSALLRLPLLLAVQRGEPDARVDVHEVGLTLACAVSFGARLGERVALTAAPWLVADLLRTEDFRSSAAAPASPARWALSLATNLRVRVVGPLSAELGSTFLLAGALAGLPSVTVGVTGTWP
jgi:hypothetical protein